MKLSIEDKEFNVSTKVAYAILGGIIAIIVGSVQVMDYLDSRHVAKDTLTRRVKMSESTRYGEIAKYYYDLRTERELTEAEKARLKLVENAQIRLQQELLDDEDE